MRCTKCGLRSGFCLCTIKRVDERDELVSRITGASVEDVKAIREDRAPPYKRAAWMSILPLGLLVLSGCYHLKNARFVDESDADKTAEVWLCVADTVEPLNVGGLMCADVRNVRNQQAQTKGPAEMTYELPREDPSVVP